VAGARHRLLNRVVNPVVSAVLRSRLTDSWLAIASVQSSRVTGWFWARAALDLQPLTLADLAIA
jgi:hypothetical protein